MWIVTFGVAVVAFGISVPAQLLKRALAAYYRGRCEKAALTARLARRIAAGPKMRTLALQIEAIATVGTGRYDEALELAGTAFQRATRSGDLGAISRSNTILAAVYLRLGRIADAYSAYQAASSHPASLRDALVGTSECLIGWGRPAEAFPLLERAQQTPPLAQQKLEQRSQGGIAAAMAIASMEAGYPEVAIQWCRRAAGFAAGTGKIERIAALVEGVSLAMLGRCDEARSAVVHVETNVTSADRDGTLTLLTYAGRISYLCGDLHNSRDYYQQFFAAKPSPSTGPQAYYYLGKTYEAQGDIGGARNAFRQAVASNIDSGYVIRCKAELDRLSGASVPVGT